MSLGGWRRIRSQPLQRWQPRMLLKAKDPFLEELGARLIATKDFLRNGHYRRKPPGGKSLRRYGLRRGIGTPVSSTE